MLHIDYTCLVDNGSGDKAHNLEAGVEAYRNKVCVKDEA